MGVYITYKILDFPDMTADGSFATGAAVAAICLTKNTSPITASVLALIAGCIAGFITGILHVKFKITNLMSSILVMIALYSINLRIMGKSNIPLFNKTTLFSGSMNPLIIILIFSLLTKIILDLFLKTKLGFLLNAVGDNEQLVTSLGVNKDIIKVLGLVISNGFVALAGALMAQFQGFADVGMGTGTVVMGLAAVIIGESIFGKVSLMKATTMTILGSLVYKGAISLVLQIGLEPTDLKLITAVIVVIALSLNKNPLKLISKKKKIRIGGDSLVANTKSI
jgi:putative ABC transport system permease protein